MSLRTLIRIVPALALVAAASAASAAHVEVQGGRSYMDSYGANTVFVESVFDPHPIGASDFSWTPDVSVGWIGGRGSSRYAHSRYSMRDDIWLLAGGARFRYGGAGDWYSRFFYSLQGAVHSGRTQALSSAGEFVNTIGWQGERFSVQLRHVSNGGLHNPNRGETMALVGVGFDL